MSGMYGRQFGADPELFVIKADNGYAYSAHLLTWPKEGMKVRVPGTSSSARMDRDGFAVEVHPEATYCRDWSVPNTAAILREFRRKFPEWKLSAKPMLRLTNEALKNAPPDVMGYGCVPDMDAYSLEEKAPETTGYHDNYRYTGGHIHLAMPWGLHPAYDHMYVPVAPKELRSKLTALAAIALDVKFAVPLVAVIGRVNDYGEAARRRYYGQAGSYREKPYGIEYRVPSSAVMLSPVLWTWAIGAARGVLMGMNSITTEEGLMSAYHRLQRYDFDRVRHIINNHDVDEARKFLADYTEILETIYKPDFVFTMVKADDEGVGFTTNLDDAWQLHDSFPIINHRYIGVERAMMGGWSKGAELRYYLPGMLEQGAMVIETDDIFPQYRFAPKTGW